jgi:hypothetical protein
MLLHFCSDLTGRDCFKLHKQHGIPPLHLDKKGEKERAKWYKIRSTDLNHVKSHPNQKASKMNAKNRDNKRQKKK